MGRVTMLLAHAACASNASAAMQTAEDLWRDPQLRTRDYMVTMTHQDLGPLEHRHLVVRSDAGAEATVELAICSAKTATLRVIDEPNGSGDLAGTMLREKCIAGTNGGYFDPEDAPVGLLIADGRVISPLSKARLLSGIVSAVNGRVQIQRAAQFSIKTKASNARQCGPFLVEGSKAIASLNGVRPARRTFVATATSDRAAIGYSSYVTLAELAAILTSPALAPDFRIQRALNLDGGSSSAFWFAGENGAFSIKEHKTVRDYLAIVAKP